MKSKLYTSLGLNAEIEVVLESWMRHPPKKEIKK